MWLFLLKRAIVIAGFFSISRSQTKLRSLSVAINFESPTPWRHYFFRSMHPSLSKTDIFGFCLMCETKTCLQHHGLNPPSPHGHRACPQPRRSRARLLQKAGRRSLERRGQSRHWCRGRRRTGHQGHLHNTCGGSGVM